MAEHRSEAGWVHYLVPWPVFPLAFIACLTSYWTWKLVEYAVIAWCYGSTAYASGLRVVNSKRGLLSDGSELTGSQQLVLQVGSGVLMVPMRLHGKRWRDVVGDGNPVEPGAAPDALGR
jgi:hypothetical protein